MDHNKDPNIYGVNLSNLEDCVTLGPTGSSGGVYGSTDTIDLSSALGSINSSYGSISLTSPYTVTGSMSSPTYSIGTNFANAVYTTNGTTTAPWMQHNSTGAKIQLDGESADITVNGWSLVDAVKRIEQRLGLYQPNPELEAEWEDLRVLGERYRELEQHIRDKQATFDRIKAMPAPEID